MSNNKSKISNRPLDPTEDFEEYVGGDLSGRAGITRDHTRESGEDMELTEEFEMTEEGMSRKTKTD